ncbi:MAG: hypothetical protein ACXACP_03365 [Candidatus Hodarchaeales archaeon]|jgi:hypothetical protein
MEFEYHDVMDSIDPINQFLKEKRQSGNFMELWTNLLNESD